MEGVVLIFYGKQWKLYELKRASDKLFRSTYCFKVEMCDLLILGGVSDDLQCVPTVQLLVTAGVKGNGPIVASAGKCGRV